MEEAEYLRIALQDVSGLRFTIESSENGQLPFLDILVTLGEGKFETKVYIKPTNNGQCLNGKSGVHNAIKILPFQLISGVPSPTAVDGVKSTQKSGDQLKCLLTMDFDRRILINKLRR